MGRLVLIILLSSVVIFGIISVQTTRTSSFSTEKSTEYFRKAYARNLSNSMIEILRTKLQQDTNYRVQNMETSELLGGEVAYQLKDTLINSVRFIKAIVYANYEGMQQKSEAYFTIESLSGGGIPPFLRYAVVSGQNLSLNGGIKITNAGNNLNANVHVNGNFSMNGNNEIHGFLTYTGSAYSNPPQALLNRITPISNPENIPVHYQTQTLTIPQFDLNSIRNRATDIYYTSKIFTGNITLGTKENPKIIYVAGDLTINGSVSGYGIFVSEGRTIINGNVTITTPDNNISNIGIYSKGELIVNGNVNIHSQIFSSDRITLNGNVKVYGNLAAKKSVIMNGNVNVYYKPVGEELVNPIWSSTSNTVIRIQTVHFFE